MTEKRNGFNSAQQIGEVIETLLRLSITILRLKKETNILLKSPL
jgi:hypothetical protein